MMRKHIDSTIGRKNDKIPGRGNNGPKKKSAQELLKKKLEEVVKEKKIKASLLY
jgi:hypothetical protein